MDWMKKINYYCNDFSEKKVLGDKISCTDLNNSFKKALKNNKGGIIFLEIPSDNYIQTNLKSIKTMLDDGFEGVYISFQRPFNNLLSLFKNNYIDVNKMFIMDCATAFCGDKIAHDPRCISVSIDFEIEDMVNLAVSSLNNLDSDKKFIFVDSLSTFSLHKSFFNISRFPELLIDTVNDNTSGHISCIFNISEDVPHKSFVKHLSSYGNQYIHLGKCN